VVVLGGEVRPGFGVESQDLLVAEVFQGPEESPALMVNNDDLAGKTSSSPTIQFPLA
jgi:hypothetical protein